MESASPACFLGRQLVGEDVSVRFQSPSYVNSFLPASCRIRRRNFSTNNKRNHLKKTSLDHPKHKGFQPKGGGRSDLSGFDKDILMDRNQEMASNGSIPVLVDTRYSDGNTSSANGVITVLNDTDSSSDSSHSKAENVIKCFLPNESPVGLTSCFNGEVQRGDQLAGSQLRDLLVMIRNAEKNINLLNQARISAVEDLEEIRSEKEVLQEKMNLLEMKLTETDSRLKSAEAERVQVEILERNDMSSGVKREDGIQEIIDPTSPQNKVAKSLSQELSLSRAENIFLQDELQMLKDELSKLRQTGERVQLLEKERSVVESSFRELEVVFTASREDMSTVSSLKSECKILYDRVGNLQSELDKAVKQADQANVLHQQNQELHRKFEQLEESLNDTKKVQKNYELMQKKVKILDEYLQKSDEEIYSRILEFQDSMIEFQDALYRLKEDSKKGEKATTVHDKPWEFWSALLLIVDGWFLAKKISLEEVNSLREMVWSREKTICDAYLSSNEKKEDEIIASFLELIPSTTRERSHVIHITAEMAPMAKVGGLGDVVTGLSKALQKKGHLVEVILPKYDCMNYEHIRDLKALEIHVESYFDGQMFQNKIWTGIVEGLPVYFIEPLHPTKLFWRGQVYGENDDFKRFSFFSRAALELILQAGKRPDIIHCHDWQTAFVAPLYWDLYVHKGLNSARVCFTCHNFEYQGTAPASDLSSCGLDINQQNRPDRMQDNFANDRVNPVKGAIVFSNILTTVSPSYAQEVRTAEGGRGLHSTLNSHSKKFVGILNGIDTDAWNPATDSFLKVQYNSNDIDGKAENKAALRKYLGISSANIEQPLVACIARLVPQKGIHLIRHAVFRTLELGGQFVLLGSSPVMHIQKEFEELSNQLKSHDHTRLILKYDEFLAHLIFAASDMFIIPSLFEPCGLTQMIAMRYGSIPIARKTGGLNDSVFDINDDSIPDKYKNGFTFVTADEKGFNDALQRAFEHYNNEVYGWKQLIQKVMNIDFSWNSAASLYEELYQKSTFKTRVATSF